MKSLAFLALAALVLFFVLTSKDEMPTDVLSVYNQDEFSSMSNRVGGRCENEKCLTIYVAPWCPVCKQLNPMILSLKEELQSEKVDVKIIVGNDRIKKVKQYAKQYPFPVLIDPRGSFMRKIKGQGVPFFLVSNQDGDIVKNLSGGFHQVYLMREALEL